MSIQEERRAAFDAWAKSNRLSIRRDDVVTAYASQLTDFLFDAWRAGLDSVVIDLPIVCQSDDPFEVKRDIVYAIEAAGVKCK